MTGYIPVAAVRIAIAWVRRTPGVIVLLTLVAFLIPVVGGQLPNSVAALEPGYAPTIRSLFRGSEIATLQHALLAMLVVAGFVWTLFRRRILQVPHPWVSAPLAAFAALLLGSVFISNYRWESSVSLAEWVTYAVALLTAVAGLGRVGGPIAVLSGLSAGTGLMSLIGVAEYIETRPSDPSWRIFAGWNNPNAAAGMLAIGFFVSLGLLGIARSRLPTLLAAASATLSLVAVFLTGSKGGVFLDLGIGTSVLLVATFWRSDPATGRRLPVLLTAAVTLASIFLYVLIGSSLILLTLTVGLAAQIAIAIWQGPRQCAQRWLSVIGIGLALVALNQLAPHSAGSPGMRIGNASATQDQSAGFRKQLWKGEVFLIKDNPIGLGLATYSFNSGRAGTNTITELGHSTWLQLAVEAGILAPVMLALLLLGWLVHTFRSSRSQPAEPNILRAAIVAAVVAAACDGIIESNFYYFGIGLAVFLLIGIGVQLCADAAAPEFVARPMSLAAATSSLASALLLGFAGYIAMVEANVRFELRTDPESARSSVNSLKSMAPFDADTWYLSGSLAPTIDDALKDFDTSAKLAPSAKSLRRVASVEVLMNRLDAASASLHEALLYDPNDLLTLKQLMDVQDRNQDVDGATQTARKLLEVEGTPYFKIRALPQIIPTETLEARVYLAKKTGESKTALLRPAVEGFLDYARVTLPYARQMESGGASIPGLSLQDAEKKTAEGVTAAKLLSDAYRAAGDGTGASWADSARTELEAALGGNK